MLVTLGTLKVNWVYVHVPIFQQTSSSTKGNNSEGKRSLFAQQFAASGGIIFGVKERKRDNSQLEKKTSETLKVNSPRAPQFVNSSVVSGEGLIQSGSKEMVLNKEVEEIHKENIAKLESMSHEEILEEQARIKASLGKSRNYAQRKTCYSYTGQQRWARKKLLHRGGVCVADRTWKGARWYVSTWWLSKSLLSVQIV